MPKIIILPHHELCPDGDIIEAKSGETICNILLKNNIPIVELMIERNNTLGIYFTMDIMPS